MASRTRPLQNRLQHARTYRLRKDTIQAIDDLAGSTQLYQSEIAEALLAAGLAEIAAGRWTLRRRAVVWELDGIETAP